jgi:hypothetical protein
MKALEARHSDLVDQLKGAPPAYPDCTPTLLRYTEKSWLRGLATIVVCTLITQSFERQCVMHTSAFSPSERTEPAHAS